MPPEEVVYPLHPDTREFYSIIKKVSDARRHESSYAKTAAAHLQRDDEHVKLWAARKQQAAEAARRAAEAEAARRAAEAEAARRAAQAAATRYRWATAAGGEESEHSDEEVTDAEVEHARAALQRAGQRAEQRAACDLPPIWPPPVRPPAVVEEVE